MKTKLLILHNGRPYLADSEKPEATGFSDDEWLFYHENLRDWENSLELPENVKQFIDTNGWHVVLSSPRKGYEFVSGELKFPQLVEVEGNKIIRLITKTI